MILRRISGPALAAGLLFATAGVGEEASDTKDGASVADLGWMTGTWSGPVGGGNVLEENWTTPKAGSIQSLVRMTGPSPTSTTQRRNARKPLIFGSRKP